MANDAKIETKLANLYQTPKNPPPEWNPDFYKGSLAWQMRRHQPIWGEPHRPEAGLRTNG